MLCIIIVDNGLGDMLWCCKCEDVMHKYIVIIHSAHDKYLDILWYRHKPCTWEFRVFGCKVETKIGMRLTQLDERRYNGYHIGTITTKEVIRYYILSKPKVITYCVTARIYE